MKAHRTDGVSLAFGLVFLGAAILWLTARLVTLDAATVAWLVAGSLVVAGALGIVHIAVTGNRPRPEDRGDPAQRP